VGYPGGLARCLSQTQFASAVAERANLSKTDAKNALAALEDVVLSELGNAERVKIGAPHRQKGVIERYSLSRSRCPDATCGLMLPADPQPHLKTT